MHLFVLVIIFDYNYYQVVSSCVVTLPVDMSQSDGTDLEHDPVNTSYRVHGDLQEEVWLCSETQNPNTQVTETSISVVMFHGKANFDVVNIDVGNTSVSCMTCVNQSVWVGTGAGQVILYDATSHIQIFSRYLSVRPDQSIVYIHHLTKLRQVCKIINKFQGCFRQY